MIKTSKNTKIKTVKQNRNMNFCFLIDASGSMASWKKETIDSLRAQIDKMREGAKENKSINNVNVNIGTFQYSTVEFGGWESAIDFNDIDSSDYRPDGATPLNDAIMSGINQINAQDSKNKDINVLILITDGLENSSINSVKAVSKKVREVIATDRWTIAACVPPGNSKYMENLGIPPVCITEWTTSKEGYKHITTANTAGISYVYNNATRGITKTAFFSPDLNITKTEVKRELVKVTKNFQKFNVTTRDNLMISEFFRTHTKKAYQVGNGFYQLTKKETVQDYKAIVLMDNNTGDLFSGESIRDILGIPIGGTIKLNPNFNTKWSVFVRSTSWNRKLVPGTIALYLTSTITW